jgi:hypothetical protein
MYTVLTRYQSAKDCLLSVGYYLRSVNFIVKYRWKNRYTISEFISIEGFLLSMVLNSNLL